MRLLLQSKQTPVDLWDSTQLQSLSTRFATNTHTILLQDAFYHSDCPFLCSLCSVLQWVTFPKHTLTISIIFILILQLLRTLCQLLLKELSASVNVAWVFVRMR